MSHSREVNVDAARMRPKFSLELSVPADEAILRIRQALDTPGLHGFSMTAGRHTEFLVDESERRIWSPRLSVRIDDAPGGSTLRGRFSPRPDVWTGFMFVYFLVVFLTIFGATLGYVQQLSDQAPWGYWAIPMGLLTVAAIHVASYVGQRLGAGQMQELRGSLESVLSVQFESVSSSDAEGPLGR
jgi:hypothetical protein